jgi:glycosyltransferase involved in cell wall biosynthesis
LIPESASSYEMGLKLQVSVVVPVYNQARTVSASLDRIKTVLESTGLSFELVVVNDGSLDGTLEVLRKEHHLDPRVRVLSYEHNKGKGHAVRTGIVKSRGELVMFTDGDLDISPHMISEYIKQLEDCDLVIASKRHPMSKYNAPASRKFLSRAFNLVVRILTGISLKDTQSGLKAGNGPALRAIFRLMLVKRYAFDVELLTIASLLDMQIKEMPVEINLDRGFKVKDIAKMFVDVLGISYRYRIKRYYQRQLEMEAVIMSR